MQSRIRKMKFMLSCACVWWFKIQIDAFLIKSLPQKLIAITSTDSTVLYQKLDDDKTSYYDDNIQQVDQRRRNVLKYVVSSSAFLLGSSSAAAESIANTKIQAGTAAQQILQSFNTTTIEPLDIEKIIKENTINVTVINGTSKTYINRTTFEKVQETILSKDQSWLFQPLFKLSNKSSKMQKTSISDAEILLASAIGGIITEVVRSGVLYPLQTIKTRVQTSPPSTSSSSSLQEYTMMIWKNVRLQSKIGDLYAGYWPSLIATLPAVGAYFGVRDVMKRELTKLSISKDYLLPFLPSVQMDDLSITLLSVLIADIISLVIRTPAVAFSTRRQAESTVDAELVMETEEELLLKNPSMEEEDIEMVKNDLIENEKVRLFPRRLIRNEVWSELWDDTLRQIPVVIFTDLPYLLLKISTLRLLANGTESIGEFTLLNIFVSFIVAALTTPFDVARTRILVDSDVNAANGLDGGSGEDILTAMLNVSREGESKKQVRFQNLYKGWFERSIYFGIGLAWLDPFRILAYLAIRDFILLEVFN